MHAKKMSLHCKHFQLCVKWIHCAAMIFAWQCMAPLAQAVEGMYPISEIGSLDLSATGLKLSAEEIFSSKNRCLVDGICRVNTCTGSFVSPDGLIITNHHCAYRAIQTASTAQTDYLAEGFQARQRSDEIPSKGYTVRITESFRDVSREVLAVTHPEMPFLERTKAIEKRQKELEKIAENENPGLRAEVAEMFIGKSYMLFLYTYLKDVRLVFAPPAAVGNFGGDVDNWEWPRHTGDFSFMRAYVAPDGSSAEYSPQNVPYKPKRFIQIDQRGVDENDFVMLLGYPGRTGRHKTSHFLRFERDVRLPFIVDLYQWEIGIMQAAGQQDRSVALKHTSRIQSLANVEKRSRGQLKGLHRARLVENRELQERELQQFIEEDPSRRQRYHNILDQIGQVYARASDSTPWELTLNNLPVTCRSLSLAFTVYDAARERAKPDVERESAYMDRNIDLTRQQLILAQQDLDLATDRLMLRGMLERLVKLTVNSPSASQRQSVEPNTPLSYESLILQLRDPQELDKFIDNFFAKTRISDVEFLKICFSASPDELDRMPDSAIQLIAKCYPKLMDIRAIEKQRDGELNQLYGKLTEVKQSFLASRFVPDANSTLRLTYGNVRGFSPEDAIYKLPITTLKGVIDKSTGVAPFITPEPVLSMYKQRNFGNFAHPRLGEIPVALLYDTDTTGGNSGSPILNNAGHLVGVNFDRAFEATINDFAWNQDYSRSIGVDIRYILWITGSVYNAGNLLREMGVE